MIKPKLSLARVGAILIGISILFAHGYVQGEEDWRIYGVTKYFTLFYDLHSISHPSRNIVKLWIKSVSKCNDTKDWAVKDHPNCANVEWLYVLTLTEIDCSKKQDRDMKSIGYSKEGRESLSDETSQWSDIIADSYADVLYKVVCP
jgi:hypothetical protein